jgi:neutral ceramidase
MDLQAGFAEVNINPRTFPARTYWAPVDTVIDPLFAHAAVFHDGTSTIAFLSLDVVIVEREYVLKIRKEVSEACAIHPGNIMVCATHNHACPAVVERPWSKKDSEYLDHMVEQGKRAVVEAYYAMVPVETGAGTCFEGRVSFNRRFIMKDGSVISQPSFDIVDKSVLYGEGTIDPEVGVLCVRDMNQRIIGILVNFACHAVHLMGSLSAGFPGVLSDRLKEAYGQNVVCVFLNGACGNVIHTNYADPEYKDTKEKVGLVLAADVMRIVAGISYSRQRQISAATSTIAIKYRDIDGLERNIDNLAPFNVFQGLIAKGWYQWSLNRLRDLHAKCDHEDAEIQVLRIGDTVFGAVPAEYFSQHSLRIKEQSPVADTFVVSLANGWLGYIPHKEAFGRIGGHESTWCISSKMEPDAGDCMADAMLDVIRRIPVSHHTAPPKQNANHQVQATLDSAPGL